MSKVRAGKITYVEHTVICLLTTVYFSVVPQGWVLVATLVPWSWTDAEWLGSLATVTLPSGQPGINIKFLKY